MSVPFSNLFFLLAAYLAGCFNTGYYLFKWLRADDVRKQGSGATGATNVSRELGRSGFIITFLGDFLKGALVVMAARWLGLGEVWLFASMVAVVAGHIWPVQLHFRGGKGVATTLGVVAFYDVYLLLGIGTIFLLLYILTRYYTLSGLTTFVLTPVLPLYFDYSLAAFSTILLIMLMITWAQRDNIREVIAVLRERDTR